MNLKYRPDYSVPPGATLKEVRESLGMSLDDLAERAGLYASDLAMIEARKRKIGFYTAQRLERSTGVPLKFWMALEKNRQNWVVRFYRTVVNMVSQITIK